jgi:hypothetical protein
LIEIFFYLVCKSFSSPSHHNGPLWMKKLMCDLKIFTHLIKFYHPFFTIINKHILWNRQLAYYCFFQKFDNSFNSMFTLTKRIVVLLKAWGMEDTNIFLLKHLTKVIFLTVWQTKHLIKKVKNLSRWPKLSQIDHTQWPLWFIINQIEHFNLTLNKINHTNFST